MRSPSSERDFPAFQITEQSAQGELVRAARRPEYVVVTYIVPYTGNETAFRLRCRVST